MDHAKEKQNPALPKALAQDVNIPARELLLANPLAKASPEHAALNDELSPQDQKDNRDFLRALYRLAVPIVFQSLINAAVNSADVFMLAYVHQNALSATALAGQVTFVLTLCHMGLSTGTMILGAQYWGSKSMAAIEKVQGYALRNAAILSLLFFFATLCFPQALMRLFTPDKQLATLGAGYLQVVGFSYLLMGGSQIMLATLKSIERTKLCAFTSCTCLLINVVLNALAIFVLFPGKPMLAVCGVAGATVLARAVELLLCLLWSGKQGAVPLRIRHMLHPEPWLRKSFQKCALPVQINFLVWGGALTATTALMGHVSAEMVAASSVAISIRNLAAVASTGLSNSGGILLGKHLGAQRIALSKRIGDKLRRWSLLLGATAGLVVLLVRPLCLHMTIAGSETPALLDGMLLICAYCCIGKSYNSTLICGVFAAGGDTKFGLYCDAFVMWGVVLPLGCLFAFGFQSPPLFIFFVLSLDEFIKMPIVARHYRKYAWLQSIILRSQ